MALALVISLNVQRRDLTAGQRAIVAARCVETFPERRGGDQKGKTSPIGRSVGIVAKEFKVSDKSVQQARPCSPTPPILSNRLSPAIASTLHHGASPMPA